MKTFPFLLLAAVVFALSGCGRSSPSAAAPVEVGKTYLITFPKDTVENIATGPAGFLSQYGSYKVLKVHGGPWVEVESSWTPQMKFDSSGKSVPPTANISTFNLNLNHALMIKEFPVGGK